MEEALFVIKCLIVTIVLVVCLQIRVGSHTVEGHMMGWIHHSQISHGLQDVAEGAVKIAHKSKEAVSDLIGSHSASDEASPTQAGTGGWFKIKRSAAYYRQKEREEQKRSERQSEDERTDARMKEESDQVDRD